MFYRNTLTFIHFILFMWGVIMCTMNIAEYTSIPWWLATMPFYAGPAVFVAALLTATIFVFLFNLFRNIGRKRKLLAAGICPCCGKILEVETDVENPKG